MSSSEVGRGIYRWSCPNCGGPNTESRLAAGLPCERCLRRPPRERSLDSIRDALAREGTLSDRYERLYRLEIESRNLMEFFEKAVGSKPWGAQRTWSRRLVRGDSFSIIAPTGVGKTTFGLVAALYYACKEGLKSYIAVPTTTLVVQAREKLRSMSERVGCAPRIIAFHAKMPRKQRAEALEAIEKGDFDILISTAAFMRKYNETLSKHRFRLVFVDDVDAVLRSAKSVDAVLKVVGFGDEDIELGLKALALQRRLASIANRYRALMEAGKKEKIAELREEYKSLEREWRGLQAKLRELRGKAATLIVSSATGRPRGRRVRLFRVLLGFEAGGRGDIGLRNVVDVYTDQVRDVYSEAARIVKELGDGTLVFVPMDQGVEAAEALAERLRQLGVKAEAYHAKKPLSVLEDFESGKLEVLVGVANYYGTLVRGLDLPERVKYAVFAGIPRHRFSADVGEPHPTRMLRLLSLLADIGLEDVASTARRYMASLRRLVRNLSPAALQMLAERVSKGEVEKNDPTWTVMEAYTFLRNALRDPEVWSELKKREDVAVIEEDGKLYLLIPDAATYLQASGRTSRLYAGGVTKGLSVVVVDDKRLLSGLIKRSRWMADVDWHHISEVDLAAIKKEILEDRMRVKRILGGEVRNIDLVKTALLIVESPNKARTIARFFGQPSVRILEGGTRVYEVATGNFILSIAASGGHVYDLVGSITSNDIPPTLTAADGVDIFGVYRSDSEFIPVYTSLKRCLDCGYQFVDETDRCPRCGSTRIKDSRSTIEDLARIAWEVDIVLIGTDPDTEGEKIGWDTSLLLRPYSRAIARLEFHEVTRPAILKALKNLRDFDQRLVDAQIVRRVEDRWIGYTLSPLLWCDFWPRYYCRGLLGVGKTVALEPESRNKRVAREVERCMKEEYNYALSAGRVQTPTLGWVVSRTEEARKKVNLFILEFDGARIAFREDETPGVNEISGLAKPRKPAQVEVKVEEVERRSEYIPPPPPYTTDTLLADASRYLGLGAPETMALAQNLFEWGLITYHRTDSVRVSERGMEVAREWILSAYPRIGEELLKPRRWGEGGAHEAIRPTRPIDAATLERLMEEGVIEVPGAFTRRHLRLYDMIFRRFMASQMKEALIHRAKYRVSIPPHEFSLEVERVIGVGSKASPEPEPDDVEAGFLHVWHPFYRVQRPLPLGFREGLLSVKKIRKVQPYTQGELIEEMKRRGIGRPSTYAKIVDTLLRRGYVARVGDTMIVATLRGRAVYEYLTRHLALAGEEYGELSEALKHVPSLVSEERTRTLESYMDAIEEGRMKRGEVLNQLFEEIWPIASAILGRLRGDGFLSSLRRCVESRPRGFSGGE
ncbi:MAG: reverse gyrase [Desulfurococcales archaeon]|nr:reverse gyrase [Desulfurococcales archaeon]